MILSEYLVDFPIFELLKVETPNSIIPDAETMDTQLILEHGQKTMFEGVISLDHAKVVKMISLKFADRWNALVKREVQLQNFNTRRELKETTTNTEDRTSNTTGTEKVSAFNSETLVDNAGNTGTGNEKVVGEVVRELIDEQIDPKNAYEMLNVNAQDTILTTVVADVGSFLTLSVY